MNLAQVIIIGAGGFATQVIETFEANSITIAGLVDDTRKEPLMQYAILGTIKDLSKLLNANTYLFCAIGNVQLREQLYAQFPDKHINCIHPTAHIGKYTELGQGNYIGPHASIMPGAKLGHNNIVDPLVVISHDVSIGNHNHLAAHACILGTVQIGNCNLIGANSTILPKINLNDYNVLGAGAVCTKNVDNNRILKGIPAK